LRILGNLEEQTGIYLLGGEGLIPLRENPLRYSGNTYLLTGNFTFSSASSLAWAFQYFKMGKIIGEETGGLIVSYGNVFDAILPNTGLPYGISKWKVYGYGASEDQKHGVIPDIIVPAEKAMDTAIEIIKNKKTDGIAP
jgi:C-terminal processing protease CtpA/Prc